jgi:hypothetical protein
MLGTFERSTPLHDWAERELTLQKLLDKPGLFRRDREVMLRLMASDSSKMWSSLMSIIDAAT